MSANEKNAYQPSLFGEDEAGEFSAPAQKTLTVANVLKQNQQGKPQSKQQAAFQRLIRQIEDRRAQIETWKDYQKRYNERVAKEYQPLVTRLREKQLQMLKLLDGHFDKPAAVRGKKQREKLSSLILELTRDLLDDNLDETVLAIHDKHADLSFKEEQALEKSFSIEMVESLFGVRLNEEELPDGASMEELFAHAARTRFGPGPSSPARPERKKSAKAIAAEEKRLAAEKEVSQSVREVYRKLASALHPDRHSNDSTPAEKTVLMQRVNRAYDEGNLLELLSIQLEIEQIDADHLAGLADTRVAHYNKVLREQLKELENELKLLCTPFLSLLKTRGKIHPEQVDHDFNSDLRRLEVIIRQLDMDLQACEDSKGLAQMLKNHQMREEEALMPMSDFDFMPDFMEEAIFGGPPMKPRGRRKK